MSQIRRRQIRRKKRTEPRRRTASSPLRKLAHIERLEDRVLLAGDINPWHNPVNPYDVDGDTHTKALDALIVLTDLNRYGSMDLGAAASGLLHSSGGEGETPATAAPLPNAMVDVNGDQSLTPLDVLTLYSALNRAEGEPDPMVRFQLKAVEDVAANTTDNPFDPTFTPNTPRNAVGTIAEPLAPGATFRVEVRGQDLQLDDDNNPTTPVGNTFGVFAAFPDIYWDEAMAFTIPTLPLPITDEPFALDLEQSAEDGVLGDWVPGEPAPSGFAVPVSFRNGDFTQPPLPASEYIFSNGPIVDATTPGLLNDTGAINLSSVPTGKSLTFVYDVVLQVESIVGNPDGATTPEDSPVTIAVLSNDSLNDGMSMIHVGAPDAKNGARTGTDTLLYSFTGFDSNGPNPNGEGFVVPSDRHELLGIDVYIDNPAEALSIVSFTQPAEGKGTVERIGNEFRFTPTKDVSVQETDTFTYTLDDGQGNTKVVDVTVTIDPVDAAPQITAPASVALDEDTSFDFVAGAAVSVVEADGQNLNVELIATSAITIAAGSGVTLTVDDGANGNLTFNGTEQQVNDALAGLTFTPIANYYGDGSLQINVQDLLADDSTPIHTVSHLVSIDVRAINDRPETMVPGDQVVLSDALPLVLSVSQSNEISVSDALDLLYADGDFEITVTLNVNNTDGVSDDGELALISQAGLTSVTGSNTNTLVITGTTAAVNAALATGVTFDNAPVGTFNVLVATNDLGNVDKNNAALIDDDSFQIQVIPPSRPFAADDAYDALEDSGPVDLLVLANDFNLDSETGGANLTITDVTQPTVGGTVVNNGDSVTFTPSVDFAGLVSFTYTIADSQDPNAGDGPSTANVIVDVAQVNDEPDFTTTDDPATVITALEDAGLVTIPNWVADFEPDADPPIGSEDFQSVERYIISGVSNPTLFAFEPAVSANGTLTYTPAAEANGSSTFTVQVQDNGGTDNGGDDTSGPQTFTIEIIAVNDAPDFTAANPPAVNEDAGPQTIVGWASNFDPGPDDESEQVVNAYDVSNVSNLGLFSSPPTLNTSGDLSYTPALNQHGTSTFTVTVQDDGGTANDGIDTSIEKVFTITVNSVNDMPAFTGDAIPTVNEDSGEVTLMDWITSFNPGPNESEQAPLAYHVTAVSNPGLFAAGPVVGVDGTLSYTPASNASGTSTFNLAVQDNGGTANGGIDTSGTTPFTIFIQSENDAPLNLLDEIADFASPSNTQSTDDGVALAFNATNGNLLQVTDLDDDGSAVYTVDVNVIGGDIKGTLSFGPVVPAGLTMANGDGTASLQLEGTRADINTAIDGMVFHPAAGLNNEDVLLEMISNDGGASGEVGEPETDTDTITIAVAPINDPPVANDDNITTSEGAGVDFNVFQDNGNGADSPGPNEGFQDIDVFSFDTTGTVGTVALIDAETGQFSYTPPDGDFNGTTTFKYTIQDNGQSRIDGVIQDDFKQDSATVTITITEVNDAPTAEDDLLLMQPSEGNPGQVVRFSVSEVLGNDSPGPANESGQQLRVVSVGNSEKGATVSLDDKGTSNPLDDEIVYTVPSGFDHVDRIEVTISDNGTTNGQAAPLTATSIAEIRDVVRSKVSGYAFVDADQQGDMDPVEFGIGGSRVTISGWDISGEWVQRSTITDSNGHFEFDGVMPNGDLPYTLEQDQPLGWLNGTAIPGTSGGVVAGANQIEFHLPVTGVGNDPENSEAANYNFAEWGLSVEYASLSAADLLHSGSWGGPAADEGIVFLANPAGELEWFIDVGGWSDYMPGVQSLDDANTYDLSLDAAGAKFSNVQTDAPYTVPWENPHLHVSFRGGAMMGRVLNSASDNGLPTSDSGGEGEGFADYVSDVDTIFGLGGLE